MIHATLEDIERAPWMQYAAQMYMLGVREKPGKETEPWIEFFNGFSRDITKAVKATDEVSWCASFVNYCLEMSGCESSHSARARSYEKWCLPLTEPRYGCVVVFSDATRGPSAGHVSFFTRPISSTLIECLGGNQGNAVSLAQYPLSRVVAFRTPNKFP